MASSKDYLEYILEQLRDLEEISYRPMMGEYVLYYRGKVFGGIYDNRFLVKPVKSALELMPDASFELPYEGGKEMLMVENPEDRELMAELLNAMYDELPAPKKRKGKKLKSNYSFGKTGERGKAHTWVRHYTLKESAAHHQKG